MWIKLSTHFDQIGSKTMSWTNNPKSLLDKDTQMVLYYITNTNWPKIKQLNSVMRTSFT